jgi:ABC-type proline/glycine betaine transport system substrate-binding protein
LLRDVLKFDVEIVRPSWNTVEDLNKLAMGDIDANFEVWPRGKDAAFAEHFGPGMAIDAGVHLVEAKAGMYVPRYAADGSDVFSYHQLEGEEVQSLFSQVRIQSGEEVADPTDVCGTEDWNCSSLIWQPQYCTGRTCKAQLLRTGVSEDTGILEQQIRNNGLNISVAYLSYSTQEHMVWEAYTQHAPVLFYSWSHRSAINGIPSDRFIPVAFPPSTKECQMQNNDKPNGGFACDLGSEALRKVVSQRFASAAAADALRFAERFVLEEKDFEWLLDNRKMVVRGVDPDAEVACMFVRAFEDRWKSWDTYTKQEQISWQDPCWPAVGGQLLILAAVAFCSLMSHCIRSASMLLERKFRRMDIETGHGNSSGGGGQPPLFQSRPQQTSSEARPLCNLTKYVETDTMKVKSALRRRFLCFMSQQRTIDNFVLQAGSPAVVRPPVCNVPMRAVVTSKRDVLYHLACSSIRDVVVTSALLCVAGGVWGTIVHIVTANHEANSSVEPGGLVHWEHFGDSLQQLTASFSFMPVFLLGFFVNRETSRWVSYVDQAWVLTRKVKDVAICLAGASKGLDDVETRDAHRGFLFKAYRYLNAVHYLTYVGVDARIGASTKDAVWDLFGVGFLTEGEARDLQRSPESAREQIVSWFMSLWHEMLRTEAVESNYVHVKLIDLHNALVYIESAPSLAKVMLKIVMSVLILLILLAWPFQMQVKGQCLQPYAIASTFFLCCCYLGLLQLMTTLEKSPFFADGDCVNVDTLLCSTEQSIFHMLRTSFHGGGGKAEIDETLGDVADDPGELAVWVM